MIKSSDVMLVLRWDMPKKIVLDQVMRQEDLIYAQEFGSCGTRFNPSLKEFAQF